jgi:hypothetical protein
MNKKENITLIICLIAIAMVVGYFYYSNQINVKLEMPAVSSPTTGQTSTPAPTSLVLTASLNQKVAGLGVSLRPVSVTEDSRCPVGVQCVWAGTVKVQTVVGSGLGESTMTLELNKSITTEAEIVTLILVSPNRNANQPPVPADYRFAFKVEKRK